MEDQDLRFNRPLREDPGLGREGYRNGPVSGGSGHDRLGLDMIILTDGTYLSIHQGDLDADEFLRAWVPDLRDQAEEEVDGAVMLTPAGIILPQMPAQQGEPLLQ